VVHDRTWWHHGWCFTGASDIGPATLGTMVSGGKWSGGGVLPHLGFDGCGEAAACSRNDELLRCSPIVGVDGAQVIL
jgi:hypothetical protein